MQRKEDFSIDVFTPGEIFFEDVGDVPRNKGFIPTDTQMRYLDFPNIFAADDIAVLAQPKLGHIAIIQASIAAATLLKELGEDDEMGI